MTRYPFDEELDPAAALAAVLDSGSYLMPPDFETLADALAEDKVELPEIDFEITPSGS